MPTTKQDQCFTARSSRLVCHRRKELAKAIIASVSYETGVSIREMNSACRDWNLVWARWSAMMLVNEIAGGSSVWISGLLGKKCHGTYLHAVKRHALVVATEPRMAKRFNKMRESVISALQTNGLIDIDT